MSLEPQVLADNGFFIRAKCSLQQQDPLLEYKCLLNDLLRQLFLTDDKWQQTLCIRIRKAAGEEMKLLEHVVPTMKRVRQLLDRLDHDDCLRLDASFRSSSHRRLRSTSGLSWKDESNHFPISPMSIALPDTDQDIQDPDDAEEAAIGTNTMSVRRFEYAFQKVLKAMASPNHPLVILIDDIQWATNNSLEEQLAELATIGGGGMFFLMTCRVDDLNDTLKQRLDRSIPYIQLHHLPLSGLTQPDIQELLVDFLSLEPKKLGQLSRTVFDLTQGNLLFVLEILVSFQEDDLLRFEEPRQQWIFDDHLIPQHPIWQVETLKDWYRVKILELPNDAQQVLIICACLGMHFSWVAAQRVVHALQKRIIVTTAWGLCEQAHLVVMNETKNKDDDDPHASFCHDSIHQAAYELIPRNEREAWHLKIGRALWNTTDKDEIDAILFVILGQLFLGESLILELDDRIAVASLCLRAGETAVRTSGFELSATYLEKGIGLLGPTKWRKNNTYDLCLALFNNAIDTCYATGRMERVESLIQEVLENARVFEDELRARVMLIYMLGTKQDMTTAIDRGVETLQRLGESMGKEPSKLSVRLSLAKTRRLLRRTSDVRLMRGAAMTDQRLVSIQIVLNVMWLSAYYNNALLAAMISCRMVQLSVKHGASVVSCVGFAMFATMVLGYVRWLESEHQQYYGPCFVF